MRTDTLFLIVVQVAIPYLLAITVVIGLAGAIQAAGLTVNIFWPHDLPVVLQVALMLLAADFMRYWLHRAFHRYPLMWRLHAVHHSPPQLYTINVGRFHPVEKSIQYALDTLPFALLAVAPEVLAAYFVFYALNGFFQHSNCRVYLGPLNYIVAGPELHRWHHSRRGREMNSNFGNNLIVWDILFKTRFLPEDRDVETIGIRNRLYPKGFFMQMRSPFVPGTAALKHQGRKTAGQGLGGFPRAVNYAFLREGLRLTQARRYREVVEAAKRPGMYSRPCCAGSRRKTPIPSSAGNTGLPRWLTLTPTARLRRCRLTRICVPSSSGKS